MSNDSQNGSKISQGTPTPPSQGLSRRNFIQYAASGAAGVYLAAFPIGCGGSTHYAGYPIAATVLPTTKQMLSFQLLAQPSAPNSGTGLYKTELCKISEFAKYGYGKYTLASGLPIEQRYDIMPAGYNNPSPDRLKHLANFFAITDIHITDKEAPNQIIYLQQADPTYGAPMTSIYSPVMLYSTHVLDAAIQTVNALHEKSPFDFGISLGDTCNNSQFNELRWYIDVIDGNTIDPSSGTHLGATTVDYQKPFKAAGLNPEIPWYQTLGNHDHFFIGSIPIDADPTLGLRDAYTSDKVWASGNVLAPNSGHFPCIFDTGKSINQRTYYMGVLDGSTPNGDIKGGGLAATLGAAPTVAADPNRRPLLRAEWIQEFFHTTSAPIGHGFSLVDKSKGADFACYSFLPKSNIPLKVIVLDNTQSENDGSRDIHGHGFLDTTRWNWLQAELAAGQAANQLMIIAAHIPIAVSSIGSEMEWWESALDPNATIQNAVTLKELVATLQNTPNLLMWIAGHRHLNTVKAFLPPAGGAPENGFWQVETSSLRDFPQQLRTFDIYLNSDYSVSILTVNVDPAVSEGSLAEKSRAYAIATQQIEHTNLRRNSPNVGKALGVIPVNSMDPSRPQDDQEDPTIRYGDLPDVPYCASYNAELFKALSPAMVNVLKAKFPIA